MDVGEEQYRHPGHVFARDVLRSGQPLSASETDQGFRAELLGGESSEPVLPALRHSARRRLHVSAERRTVGQRRCGHRLQGRAQIPLRRKLNAERSVTAF